MERRRAVELAGATCRHVCPQHPAQHPVSTLDPTVWGRLPQELLELTFARLPLPGICRLRTLSQHWSRSLDARSHFSATCAKVNRKIFALIIEEDFNNFRNFWVKLYDFHTNNWHVYPLYVGGGDAYGTEAYLKMSASDGGLVVFVSAYKKTKKNPLQILVVNPLTRSNRTFPTEGLRSHQLQMVQIITDCNTGHYQLIVVAPTRKYGSVAEMFFSDRNDWVSMNWTDRHLPKQFLMRGRYCITEYQGQIPSPNWVRARSIRGDPSLVKPAKVQYKMRLRACRGFLLVIAYNNVRDYPYHHEVGWLYDLCAGQWRELPQMRERKLQGNNDILMVELRWDTDPNTEAQPNSPRIYPAVD